MIALGETGWGTCMNALYCLCNHSVNLKLFQSKKIIKTGGKILFDSIGNEWFLHKLGHGIRNCSMLPAFLPFLFNIRVTRRTHGSLWSTVTFYDLLSESLTYSWSVFWKVKSKQRCLGFLEEALQTSSLGFLLQHTHIVIPNWEPTQLKYNLRCWRHKCKQNKILT